MAQTRTGAAKSAAKLSGLSVEEYLERVNSGLKKCTKCKEWRTLSEFCTDRTRHDGKAYRCFVCSRVKEKKSTKGKIPWMKGRHHTEESKRKLRESYRGQKPRLGIPHTLETREKISKILRVRAARGETHHMYKDGKVSERRDARFSLDYKRWRYDVFLRDRFTCQECGDARGGNLVAHHINPFADYPELRTRLDNGITLCRTCHDKIHAKK
jgi:hypothetical protein